MQKKRYYGVIVSVFRLNIKLEIMKKSDKQKNRQSDKIGTGKKVCNKAQHFNISGRQQR